MKKYFAISHHHHHYSCHHRARGPAEVQTNIRGLGAIPDQVDWVAGRKIYLTICTLYCIYGYVQVCMQKVCVLFYRF